VLAMTIILHLVKLSFDTPLFDTASTHRQASDVTPDITGGSLSHNEPVGLRDRT